MPFDLKKSMFELQLQKSVATGQSVDSEGVLLRSSLENGEEVVQVADGAASTYKVAGFAVSDNESISTAVAVETVTIPNTGASEETVQLSHTNLVGSGASIEALVKRNDTSAVMAAQASLVAVDATNEFFVDPATGLASFDTADAGVSVTITYRYNLTVAEARSKYFQRSVNNEAGAIFGEVSVAMSGEIHTMAYDASVDWSDGTITPTTGAGGALTNGGSGTDVSANVVVISVPTAEDPFLGLRFDFRT